MRRYFLFVFIVIEFLGWWLTLVDIKECIKTKRALMNISRYWLMIHILIVVFFGLVKYIIIAGA